MKQSAYAILYEALHEDDPLKKNKLIHKVMVESHKLDLTPLPRIPNHDPIATAREQWLKENISLNFEDLNTSNLKAMYGYHGKIPKFELALHQQQMPENIFLDIYNTTFVPTDKLKTHVETEIKKQHERKAVLSYAQKLITNMF